MTFKAMLPAALFLISLIFITVVFANTSQQPASEPAAGLPGDLYKVVIKSSTEAEALRSVVCEPILKIKDGYLVLVHGQNEIMLDESGLSYRLIARQVARDNLALDTRRDGANIGRYPLLYEEDQLRLFLVEPDQLYPATETPGLAPILTKRLRVIYKEPREIDRAVVDASIEDLEALIDNVSQDSLEAYVSALQAFDGRVTGTSGNYASRDWISDKFGEFGYDSVVIDSFVRTIYGNSTECQNVIAYKEGSLYPDLQIIVGAHRDAVPGSPGADDNGSGTAGVLELARILKDIETRLTFIFIAFDAEEQGLHGAWHYANEAVARGDSIILMLNMDMIAHYENSTDANLFHGTDTYYADLWQSLAHILDGIDISGHLQGTSGGSDHYPFQQNGYDVVFVAEYIFSSVYHSYQDSTSYMDFEYMTRMVKTSLATAFQANDIYQPTPWIAFDYPNGIPEIQPPETPVTLQVMTNGVYGGIPVSESGRMYYSVDGGDFNYTDLTEIGYGLYEATLPAQPCGTRLAYYFSVNEATGGIIYNPDPSLPFITGVADGMVTIFEDNFETDLGWTVAGSVVYGEWERGVPAGGGSNGDPLTDFDGSGRCYLTENRYWNSDVDDGITYLISPILDLSEGLILINYARWYSNDRGSAPHADRFNVHLSPNAGSSWWLVESVGPVEQASGGWYNYSFWVDDIMTPTNIVQIRFGASDYGDDSNVEAAIDAVSVNRYLCGVGVPMIITEGLPDWTEGYMYAQQLHATGGTGELTWSDKYGDLGGTGLALSSSGLISGVPSVSGQITFTALVTDEAMATDEVELTFLINDALVIIEASLPDGKESESYYCQLTSSGGTGSWRQWTDKNGDLDPAGLTLSADGTLTGTPLADGIVSFTARIEDMLGASVEKQFEINIAPAFVCGDADGDETVNIIDVVHIINFLYKSGPEPLPIDAADVNFDSDINILDVVYLINFLYKSGPNPVCE